jgi:hypothetical protein
VRQKVLALGGRAASTTGCVSGCDHFAADPAAASYTALKARLLAPQADIADLRRDLAQLRRDTHQALGTTSARPDPSVVEDLSHDIARNYLRELNQTKDEFQRTRQELVKLRTKASTARLPSAEIGNRP